MGRHYSKRTSYGHAMIVDPWGAVVAQCRDGVNVALAQIDLDYLNEVRQNMPVMKQRREDLYGEVGGKAGPAAVAEVNNRDEFLFGANAVVPSSCVFFRSSSGSSLAFVNKKPVVPGHVLVGVVDC